MARRRKKARSDSGSGAAIIVLVVLIAMIPKEVWITLGVVVLIVGGYYLYSIYCQSKKSQTVAAHSDNNRESIPAIVPASKHASSESTDIDSPVQVGSSRNFAAASYYRIPSPTKGHGVGNWIPAGQAVEVGAITIPGGMIYFGTSLKTSFGDNDPCLIDPSKSVSSKGNYTERQLGYDPSYSEMPASARRAYLEWLADGKRDPDADIGYVILYFYGLERRVIVDGTSDPSTRADWPVIAEELRRLIGIYGENSVIFFRYAGELLNWICLATFPRNAYKEPIPTFQRSSKLPHYVRFALGQTAVDAVPVPPDLALAWAKLDPNISIKTSAKRSAEIFDRLFKLKYSAAHGEGMVLPRTTTKMKLVYQPASSGLLGFNEISQTFNEISQTFGDIPDDKALNGPLRKIQSLVDSATNELDSYSRFIGRNPEAANSFDAMLLAPSPLWPEDKKAVLGSIREMVEKRELLLPFRDFLSKFGVNTILQRDKVIALGKALQAANVGVEPDITGVLSPLSVPQADEYIVLFSLSMDGAVSGSTPAYQAAVLTLELASAVAVADGEFSADEVLHLRKEVTSWSHLSQSHIQRLLARIQLLTVAPVSLGTLKNKLGLLDTQARKSIAEFMAMVAQADGTVTAEEVKTLEKVYKALVVDPQQVFSHLHTRATVDTAQTKPGQRTDEVGFRLDKKRISELQKDTERVSALLAGIFTDDETPAPALPEAKREREEVANQETHRGLLGLDETDSALARMLLSRPTWARSELADLASNLELMLDGALERINEASFDAHGIPFTEGEDPIEINAELLEKIAA